MVINTDRLAEADSLPNLDQEAHYEFETWVQNSSQSSRETSPLCGMMEVDNNTLSMDCRELKRIAKYSPQ